MSIHELHRWIDETLTKDGHVSTSNLKEVTNHVGDSEKVKLLLEELLNDNECLIQIAHDSYLHANGFDRINLITSVDPEYKLRLHIWWPDQFARFHSEHIHQHRWDFSSVILTGSLRFQEFLTSSSGEKVYEYRCFAPEGRDHYEMELVGTSTISNVFDGIMLAGNRYTLSHEVFHRITTFRDKVASTLFIHGPVISKTSRLFTEEKIETPDTIMVKAFTVPELQDKLSAYLDIL